MILKKMIAGIFLAAVISSAAFSYAATGVAPDCQHNRKGAEVQSPVDTAQVHGRIKNALDALVKDGTLSQEQEDAVIKAFDAKREQFKKEHEKLQKDGKNGNKEGKYGKRPIMKKPSILKELVQDGTITSEQADAIRKAIRSAK